MGQKVNPLGFRLGVTQEHHSYWFATNKQFAGFLEEDQKIRHYIYQYVQKHIRESSNTSYGYSGVSKIEIKRDTELIHVEIHTSGFPALLIKGQIKEKNRDKNKSNKNSALDQSVNKNQNKNTGQELEKMWRYVQRSLTLSNGKFRMTLSKVSNPYKEANIVAEYIARQLENRVAFRRAMKQAIKDAKENGQVKGIKIQISGRLNGAEIARVEWAREGRVPLQTLRAKIDYCHYPAQTKYGVLGIKVWIFQGEGWT
uniref:Small ribosomal subunit protein uS3c n=1 Tax=Chaetosphaeridium globosum TaxID=96477 RepID=RR3_CHAGL|nr:ribosomal protein S3 [Chaetosphaeridium globosum]Q8M9V0.1 RecName: Full=Small ribosomal subunit protein uS3c; AltName: Full=30S ribosomal protein S3, chloroplastic [Chaetosphaeridium globosum]AAM96576.1 ribosomal protein S3 [Chaetosphaeridium globosum]